MITLPLNALVRRPSPAAAPAAGASDADPGAPSFGDVFDRARQTPEAPAAQPERPAHDVPGERHAADPTARGAHADQAARPGVSERRFGHDRPAPSDAPTDDAATEPTAADGSTASAGTDADTDAAHDVETADAPPAPDDHAPPILAVPVPGAISTPADGALQLAATTGLAAAGVVEVSITDGPVAPAGLHPADPGAPALTPATEQPAPAPSADAPDGPVITAVQVENVPVETVPSPTAAPTTEPADAPLADVAPPPAGASPATTTPATTPDAPANPLESTAAQTAATPADPARTPSAPAAPQAAPAAAAAASAAATAAADATPGADQGQATARPAPANAAPARADAPVAAAPQTAPARSADATGAPAAPADGVVPSRIVDLVERAQRETQIRRAEHTTRIGMDITTEGLGAIRIDASNSGAGLHLNLGAERQATRQLLADQANVLRDELGGADVSVDLGHSPAGRHDLGGQPAPRDRAGSSSSASSTVPLSTAQRPSRPSALRSLVAGERGVDLHL